jgi:hypothetical protein
LVNHANAHFFHNDTVFKQNKKTMAKSNNSSGTATSATSTASPIKTTDRNLLEKNYNIHLEKESPEQT